MQKSYIRYSCQEQERTAQEGSSTRHLNSGQGAETSEYEITSSAIVGQGRNFSDKLEAIFLFRYRYSICSPKFVLSEEHASVLEQSARPLTNYMELDHRQHTY
jgi:hypothetical protein